MEKLRLSLLIPESVVISWTDDVLATHVPAKLLPSTPPMCNGVLDRPPPALSLRMQSPSLIETPQSASAPPLKETRNESPALGAKEVDHWMATEVGAPALGSSKDRALAHKPAQGTVTGSWSMVSQESSPLEIVTWAARDDGQPSDGEGQRPVPHARNYGIGQVPVDGDAAHPKRAVRAGGNIAQNI